MNKDSRYSDVKEMDVAIVKALKTTSRSGGCEWCNLSEEDKRYLLYEDEYWMLFLADKQDYVGRSILVSKRHCGTLSELNETEWMDLYKLIRRIEECARLTLGADVCNWSCLLNNFFKEENPNPHLHIHCRPRFRNTVTIGSSTYADAEFGHHYAPEKETAVTSEEMTELFQKMKEVF